VGKLFSGSESMEATFRTRGFPLVNRDVAVWPVSVPGETGRVRNWHLLGVIYIKGNGELRISG
jgi:hypothetical protein